MDASYAPNVKAGNPDRERTRRRQHVRLDKLKRWITVSSVFGFATLFGLATHHAVRGSSAKSATRSSARSAAAAPTSFFDEQSGGFSFDDGGTGFSQAGQQSAPPPPPVAQTSVS
jgi:hypothetical protein